jgi:guanine deaminase
MAFGENGASVDRVMIGGRTVFHGGRLLTIDEADLRTRAEQAARRLDESNAETFVSASAVSRLVGAFCAAQGCEMHSPRRKIRIS